MAAPVLIPMDRDFHNRMGDYDALRCFRKPGRSTPKHHDELIATKTIRVLVPEMTSKGCGKFTEDNVSLYISHGCNVLFELKHVYA
jgi:hypothetical protein